jgi:hypothetical protein
MASLRAMRGASCGAGQLAWANAGTNTSGAGGLYPIEAWGLSASSANVYLAPTFNDWGECRQ